MTVAYVDASALTKLLLEEVESSAMLRWYVEAERVVTNRIGIVETRRAVARRQPDVDDERFELLSRSIETFELNARIGQVAATIGPASLRTLDAIHLATALAIGGIDAFVTYDDRLADAARSIGLPVVRPA